MRFSMVKYDLSYSALKTNFSIFIKALIKASSSSLIPFAIFSLVINWNTKHFHVLVSFLIFSMSSLNTIYVNFLTDSGSSLN